MQPDGTNVQPLGPASLPAVPTAAQQPAPVMPAMPPASGAAMPAEPVPAAQVAESAVQQAQQVVQRYGQDPYHLADAFAQLKAGYLAHQYHIIPGGGPNAAGK